MTEQKLASFLVLYFPHFASPSKAFYASESGVFDFRLTEP